MIRHNKILVPIDFSEPSAEAIRRASVLAEKFDAEMHLLHVLAPSVYFETDMVSVPPINEVNHAAHDGAVHRLQALADQFDFEVVTHIEESAGDPARFICGFAASLSADLIVIGRHDEKGVVEHMLMGSTVERIVAHAPCSVLVTMPHDLLEKDSAWFFLDEPQSCSRSALQLAEVFKALGEPVRLRLFSLLAHSGEICVCDLTEALELPQSTISRHLGLLRHAGLVSARRDGKWMYYRLCDDVPVELPAMLLQAHDVEDQLAKDLLRLKASASC